MTRIAMSSRRERIMRSFRLAGRPGAPNARRVATLCTRLACQPDGCPVKTPTERASSRSASWLTDVGRQVLIGRFELVEPRLGVVALAPGDVCGEILDVDLESRSVGPDE